MTRLDAPLADGSPMLRHMATANVCVHSRNGIVRVDYLANGGSSQQQIILTGESIDMPGVFESMTANDADATGADRDKLRRTLAIAPNWRAC